MNTGLIKYALIAFAALLLVLTLNPFVVIGAGERADDGVFWPQVRFDRKLFVHEV